MAFQDEQLARWIAESPVPVVMAVGHEVDHTIADLVADAVAPTPTASAVMVLPDGPALALRIDDAEITMSMALQRIVDDHRRRIIDLAARLQDPRRAVWAMRVRRLELAERLSGAIHRFNALQRTRLVALEARLAALSPYGVLARGYAIVTGPEGIVTDPDAVASDDPLQIRLAGGTLAARVGKIAGLSRGTPWSHCTPRTAASLPGSRRCRAWTSRRSGPGSRRWSTRAGSSPSICRGSRGRSGRGALHRSPASTPSKSWTAPAFTSAGFALDHNRRLRVLRCRHNRLRDLDLASNAALEVLDCAHNQLMVLDLRGLDRLHTVDCSANGLGAICLPRGGHLGWLDCAHNQLMVLDLGDQPELVVVRAFRNALVRFTIGCAPALERLDLSHNQLEALALPQLPGLTDLTVGYNRLPDIPTGSLPRLARLDLQSNYVDRLDLAPLAELQELFADRNQLIAVDLGPSLREAHVAKNRLTHLGSDKARLLEILDCRDNQLTELRLDGLGSLHRLDCRDNGLHHLDPGPCPALVDLRWTGNPLEDRGYPGPAMSTNAAMTPFHKGS